MWWNQLLTISMKVVLILVQNIYHTEYSTDSLLAFGQRRVTWISAMSTFIMKSFKYTGVVECLGFL